MSWLDEDCWYWFEQTWEVWDEDEFGAFFVGYCRGEFEARDYEYLGYYVCEPYRSY